MSCGVEAIEVQIHIRQVYLADEHIEIVLHVMFLQQAFQGDELPERCLVVLGVIIVVAIVVQKISLHSHRHGFHASLRLLIVAQRCLPVVELLIDGGKTHVERHVVLLGQLERIHQEECSSVPRGSLYEAVLEEIGVSQIGTHQWALTLQITLPQQRVGTMIEPDHLVGVFVEVVQVDSLAIISISQQSVAPRR